MRRAFACAVVALAGGCTRADPPAPSPQTVTLDSAVQHPFAFSGLEAAAELRNGMLVVADRKERKLMLVDFASGMAKPLSREGKGPLEYGYNFGRLLEGGGDTVYYRDFQNARLLLIGPDGMPARTAPFKSPSSAARQFSFVAVDRTGRIYGAWRSDRGDTVFSTLARFDAAGVAGDSLATRYIVPQLARPGQTEISAGSSQQDVFGPDYLPVTVWAVLPDGRAAILRDSTYRVEFSDGYSTTFGPSLSWARIPVTKAERMARIDSIQAEYRNAEVKPMTESGQVIESRVVDPPVVSSTKPPFTELRASPSNMLWVRVPSGPDDRGTHYEILDSTGVRVSRVAIPAGEKMLAIGRAVVYTTRTDADGFMYLRRYPVPGSAPGGAGARR